MWSRPQTWQYENAKYGLGAKSEFCLHSLFMLDLGQSENPCGFSTHSNFHEIADPLVCELCARSSTHTRCHLAFVPREESHFSEADLALHGEDAFHWCHWTHKLDAVTCGRCLLACACRPASHVFLA